VIFGPGNEACAFSTGWILYAGGRVDLHHAGIERPAEQPAQGIEKVTRLERGFGTPLSTSDDRARGNLRKRLGTRRFKHLLEAVIPLPSCRRGELGPRGGLAIPCY